MAKKKQGITKKRLIKDSMNIEGFLRLENLHGFCVDMEEEGLKDISKDWQELQGKLVKVSIVISDEEDLTNKGFNDESDESDL